MSAIETFLLVMCVFAGLIIGSLQMRLTLCRRQLAMWRAVRRDLSSDGFRLMIARDHNKRTLSRDEYNALVAWSTFLQLNGEWE